MASATHAMLSSQFLRARVGIGRINGVVLSIHWSWFPCLILWAAFYAKWYSSWYWSLGQILG